MSRPHDSAASEDRWHFLPDFADLVQKASRCVLRARAMDPLLAGEDPLRDPGLRWRAALDWHEAAKAEEQLVDRLLASDRVPAALRSLLHATQYHLWAGDPFAAGRPLQLSESLARSDVDERWREDRVYLVHARESELSRYSTLMERARTSGEGRPSVEMLAILFPGLGHTLLSLAQLHHRNRDLVKALEVAQFARRFRPEDLNARVLESSLLFDLGRIEPAVALMRECWQVTPDSAVVRVMLANILVGSWLIDRTDRRKLEEAHGLLSLVSPHERGSRLKQRAGLLHCFVLFQLGAVTEAEEYRLHLWSSSSPSGYVPELLERPVPTWDPKLLLDILIQHRTSELSQAA